MNTAVPAVRFETVSKTYGGVTAVDRVSFSIAAGSLVTLLGPSGCGKTTTLRMIAGLEAPSSGRILIGDADVTGLPASERDVSMVFQSYALFPHMTVLENVCYGLRASGIPKRRAEELAIDKLGSVGLAGFERRLPSELSGGQQQRVAVARAIVLEPKVLLFDEPLSNLDVKLRRRVREDIRALQQSLALTAVYVTHDQEEALAVSDRIIVMRNARVVQDGSPRELYQQPADRFIADFIGNANLLPVTAERIDGTTARVRLQGFVMTLPHRGLLDGTPPRADLLLAVRPEAIRIRPGRGASGELTGRVRKAIYLGGHLEYEIAIDGIEGEVLVIAQDTMHQIDPDTPVIVDVEPHGAVLLPAGEA